MYREVLDLPPEDAWVAIQWTLLLMLHAVGMERHDVHADGLAGHVLDPSAREELVTRLAGYVGMPKD